MGYQVHEAWARRAGLIVFAAVAACASLAQATPINHGDFGPDYPPGVTMYLDVTESSATDPLPPARYGPPTINGNNLDFDPKEFAAFASTGAVDTTDVQLNFTLMSLPLTGITSISIAEGGDFSLDGAGTALTKVVAAVSLSIKILEVDGVPLASPISTSDSESVMFDWASDAPAYLAPWTNGLFLDLVPVLNEHEISYEWGVSKAEVVIDDFLLAFSEPETFALIAKKEFSITTNVEIDPNFSIPEPSTVALMMVGMVGFGAAFRRRLVRARR